ncbi:MAG: hypothetical protein DRP42_07555 [Tenericutes bacterium]|nr:MAG: hypothetical protein DRP42_07555 [Mycoplasmatota bacterium]
MKYFPFLLIIAVLSFADNDGCTGISSGAGSYSSDSDDINLTLINDWVMADLVLGLDVFQGSGITNILAVDKADFFVRIYDANTGILTDSMPLDPANDSCFGVVWNNDIVNDTYYKNDWWKSNFFFTDDFGATWTTVPDPSGWEGRGMDFDGTDYWMASLTIIDQDIINVTRFQPGLVYETINIPEVPTQPSGLTVFPIGSNLCVAVTAYLTHFIYFYEWDGSTLTFIGSADCPASNVASSYGLAYEETSGNIFWTYKDNSYAYHLAEFSFEMLALEQTSWGDIKSSF